MITFSIDTMPLSKRILNSNDYSSKIIFSAVTDPLFKYDVQSASIIKNACTSYEYSKDRKKLRIIIRNDLYFSNGINVNANDYYKTFKHILSSKTHIGIIFRRFFKEVSLINDYTIELENKDKNNKSFEILSIYSTGCLNENLSNGPYYIDEIKDDIITLRRNKFYRKKVTNKEANEISFILTDGINDNKLYDKNKVQITNNTMTNIKIINKYNFISEKNYIYFNIIFSNELMNNKYKYIRNYIENNLNREKLNELLCEKFQVNNTFIVGCNNKCKIAKVKKIKFNHKHLKKKQLVLGYNNFYPNKIIANELKRQLENAGLKIKLIENKFNINNTCDMNLTLNHLEYISTSSMINGSYLYNALKKNLLYSILLNLYNMTHSKKLLQLINNKIMKLKYKIPLLEMMGYYLKKDELKFNYVELNYEDL